MTSKKRRERTNGESNECEQDLLQHVGVEVVEQHRLVEAGEELRHHAVLEEVLRLEEVGEREARLDAHLAVGVATVWVRSRSPLPGLVTRS